MEDICEDAISLVEKGVNRNVRKSLREPVNFYPEFYLYFMLGVGALFCSWNYYDFQV